MGIFTDQRVRLLRDENWDANGLAEELYSMFGDDGPLQIDSPVQVTNNTPLPAMTITNTFNNGNGPSLVVNGGTVTNGPTTFAGDVYTFAPDPGYIFNPTNPSQFPPGPGTTTPVVFPANGPPGPAIPINLGGDPHWKPDPTQPGPPPGGPPTTPGPDAPVQPGGGGLPPPSDWPPSMQGLAAGNNGSYMGKVVSGSGPVHQVKIMPQGLNGADGPIVAVNLPMVASGQSLDVGYVITGINRTVRLLGGANPTQGTVEYWGSVPVWLG